MKEGQIYSFYDYAKEFFRIALSRNNAYENPVLYEKLVNAVYGREKVAGDIARMFSIYLPPSQYSTTTILEEAAGTGIVSFSLARLGYNVIATDIQAEALRRIEEKNIDSLPIISIRANINERLPLEGDSVDGITIVSANRYITDLNSFLSEAYRVVKPGGIFIWPIPLIRSVLWRMDSEARNSSLLTISYLSKAVESSGFQVIKKDFVPSARRNLRNGVPLYAVPTYIVAKKINSLAQQS